ncbi:stomatin (EPB72)-like 3a isoform X1 [Phycodurus eques]|uniref:stomatin (EPB72)-like 3a isoform X1 n=1 Tax=Phycodurus eques TaxID=693459 RepID=UPI002ACD668B|nr:stomatin (EPB72)-like 3a isoform X1 [Phycodurus eques]
MTQQVSRSPPRLRGEAARRRGPVGTREDGPLVASGPAPPIRHTHTQRYTCSPMISTTSSSTADMVTQGKLEINPMDVVEDKTSGRLGCFGWILVVISLLFIGATFPFTLFMCVKIVKEYERAVIFRLGRIVDGKAKGPGLFIVIPCTDNFVKVDLRTVSFDIPPQEILTKDSVTVCVDGVVYFRIQCPISSVANVTNAHSSTRLLAQTTLRNVLGTKNLAELLSDREGISLSMQEVAPQESLDEATDAWGIKVERVEIKDVKLPQQLQRAMAAEAEASREARAKIIAAEGEMKASRALKEASLVIAEAPSALQLRYLQTLNSIAAEKNSTIIFPLPIDMLQSFLPRK